jgi:CxxC-x17-CxxC domain-containing protein
MNYEDKTLTCLDCGQPFIFSADDQSFHAMKGFMNEPKRCNSCRMSRRDARGGGGGGYSQGPREQFPVVCAECGKDTTVPFQPRGDRPVYCSDCFSRQRSATRTNW